MPDHVAQITGQVLILLEGNDLVGNRQQPLSSTLTILGLDCDGEKRVFQVSLKRKWQKKFHLSISI